MKKKSPMIFAALIGFLCCAAVGHADVGQPVAIRFWPEGGVSIETMWNLRVSLRANSGADSMQAASLTAPGLDFENKESSLFVLDRLPNELKPTVTALTSSDANAAKPSANAVTFNRHAIGEGQLTTTRVDGVSIVDASMTTPAALLSSLEADDAFAKTLRGCHVFLPSADLGQATQDVIKMLHPAVVLLRSDMEGPAETSVTKIMHNTFALSQPTPADDNGDAAVAPTRWISLGEQAWKMNNELQQLFEKKETACKASREIFAKLTVDQLNFRPANGTHTPRWNTEHMMGRELIFFSQIYNAVDPAITVMNLNPKQMPDQYVAAHADWTGMEEAAQTARVEAFTRRFAYLLDGLELDKRPAGSRMWTPRSLLMQMERHYGEHTANVGKKMDLPEWPKAEQK